MMNNRLIVYRHRAVSHADFAAFWAPHYGDIEQDDRLYTPNISAQHTNRTLSELFEWKVGVRLYQHMLPALRKNFIDRLEEARHQLKNISAEQFLEKFSNGGAIYRIFWLHCWYPRRFPIYDQHVHRAMTFITDGKRENLDQVSDQRKIELYLNTYLRFRTQFSGIEQRTVDRALWAFGKWLKRTRFPLPT